MLPMAADASAVALKWPSITTSVVMIAICASWVSTSGSASFHQFARFRDPRVEGRAR